VFSILIRLVIYSYDGKAEFSASQLQYSGTRDSSKIILIVGAQETFLIINVEKWSLSFYTIF